MTDIDYHVRAWAITLAIGLPIFGVVVWKRWKRTQTSLFWRFSVCVLLGCLLAPYVISEDFGGNVTVDVFPAVYVVSFAASGWRAIRGLWPILLASLALLLFWSMILSEIRRRAVRAT
jgi:hypothetical protein